MPVTPPMCKLCHHAHWLNEPHQLERGKKAQAAAEEAAKAAKQSKRKRGRK